MTYTTGQMPTTPMQISNAPSLSALLEAMREDPYSGERGDTGWGRLDTGTDEMIGRQNPRRAIGGKPVDVVEHEEYGEQIHARFFYEERNAALERALGLTEDRGAATDLRAADVIITKSSRSGQLFVLVSERDDLRLKNHVVPGLRDVIAEAKQTASLSVDDNDLSIGEDDDFFRWLQFRTDEDPNLNVDLTLEEVRSLTSEDAKYRRTRMSKSVEKDRRDLQALFMDATNRMGPAKFVVMSADMALTADMELTASGAFTVYRATEYEYADPTTKPDRATESLQMVQDVAFHIIPELKRLHNADKAWRKTHRRQSRKDAMQALRDHCDNLLAAM